MQLIKIHDRCQVPREHLYDELVVQSFRDDRFYFYIEVPLALKKMQHSTAVL